MKKTYYRFFSACLETQEAWLNRRAAEGLRLVSTHSFSYTFEPCEKGKYQYCVEFAGEKSYRELMDYRRFLEELGYRTFPKNINLNVSVGKVRWRPWAKGAGQVATAPGGFNKELLILEKERDGTPFVLHTDLEDRMQYYQSLRNMHLTATVVGLFAFGVSIWDYGSGGSPWPAAIFAVVTVLFCIPLVRYARIVGRIRRERSLRE